jgi:hypothetical protein
LAATCPWSGRKLATVSAIGVMPRQLPCWPSGCPLPWLRAPGQRGPLAHGAWNHGSYALFLIYCYLAGAEPSIAEAFQRQ